MVKDTFLGLDTTGTAFKTLRAALFVALSAVLSYFATQLANPDVTLNRDLLTGAGTVVFNAVLVFLKNRFLD